MADAIQMDASGRLVLPKAVRDRLSLRGGARLRADIVSNHIGLTPISDAAEQRTPWKGGVTVLARTGVFGGCRISLDPLARERESLTNRHHD